jgi:alpha-tubulin suppressor-like RCC1 family protein
MFAAMPLSLRRLLPALILAAPSLGLVALPGTAAAAEPAVAFGTKHAVALRTNGDVLTWGDNVYCQLGRASSTNAEGRPQVVLRNAKEITATGDHTLAVTIDGKVYAWGSNPSGALGIGTGNDQCEGPALVDLGGKIAAHVATGVDFSVVVTTTGDLLCAGDNEMGQCPPAGRDDALKFVPVGIAEIAGRVVSAKAGAYHVLALTRDGRLFAFGRGRDGQLGTGTTTGGAGYAATMSDVVSYGAGIWHSVAVKADGSAWAWGNDSKSQLCDGATVNRPTPSRIDLPAGYGTVTAVAVGAHGTMLKTADGSLYVCGDNQFFALGVDAAPIVPRPSKVAAPAVVKGAVIATGGYYGAISPDGCALRFTGQSDHGIVGVQANTKAFVQRAEPSLCAPPPPAPLADLVREWAKGGASGCWATRVEEAAATRPRFAPYRQAMLAVEEIVKKNAAFLDAPQPVRMRTQFSAGPDETGGARIHIKSVPERKGDGTRVWANGCEVIPQIDRIGGPIGQLSVFFNTDASGQFIDANGQAPRRTGTVGGYPEYNGTVLITKDGRLPWIPLTLADKLDAEGAKRSRALADYTAEQARATPPDLAAAERAAAMMRPSDPAGADKYLQTVRETIQELARQQKEVIPARIAFLKKQVDVYQAYRASFTPEQLRAPAVWGDPSGEAKKKLDARISELRSLTPDEQRQVDDWGRESRALELQARTNAADAAKLRAQSNELSLKARALRNTRMERASLPMEAATAEYELTNLRPGDADHAMGVKADPAFPDMKDPLRIQMITVMFSFQQDPRTTPAQGWGQRIKDSFDFAALAGLIR